MATDDIMRGHDAFPLPDQHAWRKQNIMRSFDDLVHGMESTVDSLKRLRDDIWHNERLSTGVMTPYADWTAQVMSIVVQGHGNTANHLYRMINHAGEIDALLDDARREGIDYRGRVRQLERLARDVVAAPSSRIAREKLAAALTEEN